MKKTLLTVSMLLLGLFLVPKLAAAAETSLGSFDSGGMDGWSGGGLIGGYNSANALRIHNNSNDSIGSVRRINGPILRGLTSLEMDVNLNGKTILSGDASAVVFEQSGWKYVSLKDYVQNGSSAWQHVKIPLSDFTGLNTNNGVASLTFRIWNSSAGDYDFDNVKISNNSGGTTGGTVTPPSTGDTVTPPVDPATPPAGSKTIADFSSDLGGFDRGATDNGSLKLVNPNNGDASTKKLINSKALSGYTNLEFDLNLGGNNVLDGDASAVIFDQAGQRIVSLKNRITNGSNSWQHVKIPLSDFAGLNTNEGIASIGFRFWNYNSGSYLIDNIILTGSNSAGGNTTPTVPNDPPVIPPTDPVTPPSSSQDNWSVKSVDAQVMSKYWAVTDENQIRSLVKADKAIGAKQIAVSANYNNYNLLKKWADVIHSEGLNVWFRGHWDEWDSWEKPEIKNGITSGEYLNKTKQFIIAHPELFRAGDSFTMCVESENAAWWTGIDHGPFNGWDDWRAFTRNQVTYADDAFSQIGLGGKVKTNWINMNGWVAWNELDQTTVNTLGQLTLDHIIDWTDDINTYKNALFSGNGNGFYGYDEYHNKWNVPMMAGEWGYSTFNQNVDPVYQKELTSAIFKEFANRPYIVGINYWIDVGHASRLFDTPNLLDYNRRPVADVIQQYFA